MYYSSFLAAVVLLKLPINNLGVEFTMIKEITIKGSAAYKT